MLKFRNDVKAGMVTTMAGMCLLGLALAVPAIAQDRSMDTDRSTADMDMSEPAPFQYPMAPAGGIDMYHWHSYKENKLSPGSATEKRMELERERDMRLHRSTITEDPLAVDPAPWNYPEAAPDGLDLYHFETYHHDRLMYGSVTERRMDLERERDKRRHMETRITDNMEMADPSPFQYPMAPAGGIDMYHWHSYKENMLSPGSVTEKREANERKRDRERKNENSNK